MNYFIDYITTYSSVNKKAREIQAIVNQYNQCLIDGDVSLDALKCEIECQIGTANEKYPRTLPLRLDSYEHSAGGVWTIRENSNGERVVCRISYKKVLGVYSFSEKKVSDYSLWFNHNK